MCMSSEQLFIKTVDVERVRNSSNYIIGASDVLVPSLVERPVVVGEDGGVNLIDARQVVPLGYDDLGRRVGGSPKSCAPKVADSAVQPRNVG